MLEEDFDLIADRGRLLELVEGDRALGLEADVEDDGVFGDAEDLRLDDLALGDRRQGALVHREHLLVLVLAVLLVVEVGANHQPGPGHVASVGARAAGVSSEWRVGGVQIGRGGGQSDSGVIPSGSAAPAGLRDGVKPVRGGVPGFGSPKR